MTGGIMKKLLFDTSILVAALVKYPRCGVSFTVRNNLHWNFKGANLC